MAMISIDPEFFEVKPTWDNKGNGVFSKKVLPAGTILVREGPLLRHPEHPAGFQDEQIPGLIAQFDVLHPQKQKELLALYTVRREGDDPAGVFEYLRNEYTGPDGSKLSWAQARRYLKMVVVLWSNQIGILDEQGQEHRGLYLRTSRLNHKCAPNILTNIATSGEITLRARDRILPGDELTISYIELDLLRPDRQARLKEEFGFECQCDLCDEEDLRPDADTHDHRIAQLHIYDMGETMRLHLANEFADMPLSDCDQYLRRCQLRWIHYTNLFWNDMSFYELLNIADLWARVWQLTPNNDGSGSGAGVANPRAEYAAREWRRCLGTAVTRLGPIVFDVDDEHLLDARRALEQPDGRPNIIEPRVPAPEDPDLSPGSRTPQGRPMRRRDRTQSAEPQGSLPMATSRVPLLGMTP